MFSSPSVVWNSLYLDVFSFKLCDARSDRLEKYKEYWADAGAQRDNKPNVHDFLFYINVIISYSFKSLQTKSNPRHNEGRCHLIYVIATAIG